MMRNGTGDLNVQLVARASAILLSRGRCITRRDSDGLHLIVRVAEGSLVLDEIFGLHHFADVVEVRANAAQQSVRVDRVIRVFGEHTAMIIE